MHLKNMISKRLNLDYDLQIVMEQPLSIGAGKIIVINVDIAMGFSVL